MLIDMDRTRVALARMNTKAAHILHSFELYSDGSCAFIGLYANGSETIIQGFTTLELFAEWLDANEIQVTT